MMTQFVREGKLLSGYALIFTFSMYTKGQEDLNRCQRGRIHGGERALFGEKQYHVWSILPFFSDELAKYDFYSIHC